MNDTDMLDWLEIHGEEISVGGNIDNHSGWVILAWADNDGQSRHSRGLTLRHAIRAAMIGEIVPTVHVTSGG